MTTPAAASCGDRFTGCDGRGTLRLIRKLQTQGVHHITIVGADRQTSIDFWEGVLGMPFVFGSPKAAYR